MVRIFIGYVLHILSVYNVFHHRVDQPIEWVNFPWRNQLILQLFNFIAIKQGTYIRRTRI
jgi:hypothetical protein